MAGGLRPGDQRAVAVHLVMFDRLATGNQTVIANSARVAVVDQFFGLFDQTLDRLTGHALRSLAKFLEHLFQPLDLVDGLLAMSGKGFLKGRLLRIFSHFWQRSSS